MPDLTSGPQRRKALDLQVDVWTAVQQIPALTIAADGDRLFRSALGAPPVGTDPGAVAAGAVPLRDSPSGPGSEHMDPHGRPRPAASVLAFLSEPFPARIGAHLARHLVQVKCRRLPSRSFDRRDRLRWRRRRNRLW